MIHVQYRYGKRQLQEHLLFTTTPPILLYLPWFFIYWHTTPLTPDPALCNKAIKEVYKCASPPILFVYNLHL